MIIGENSVAKKVKKDFIIGFIFIARVNVSEGLIGTMISTILIMRIKILKNKEIISSCLSKFFERNYIIPPSEDDTTITMFNTIIILCVRIPGAYFASQLFPDTLYPMGWAAPLGSILSGVICILFYLYLLKNETGNNRALA